MTRAEARRIVDKLGLRAHVDEVSRQLGPLTPEQHEVLKGVCAASVARSRNAAEHAA